MLQENERALEVLKVKGPMALIPLAKELGITTEGARFNLLKLSAEGLVRSQAEASGRGRPQQIWSLTRSGHSRFPDAYADVSVKLLEKIQHLFGDVGMQSVLDSGADEGKTHYTELLSSAQTLEDRVRLLAEARDKEGYMATYEKNENGFLLIENHCPVCAAASVCNKFCTVELEVFKAVLQADVCRIEHLLSNGRRCVYQVNCPKA